MQTLVFSDSRAMKNSRNVPLDTVHFLAKALDREIFGSHFFRNKMYRILINRTLR